MTQSHAPRAPADVRNFFSAWLDGADAGDWDRFADLLHADIMLVDPMAAEPAYGRAAALERVKAQYQPFPDGRMEIIGDPFVALEEPELAYRWRFRGTHLRRVDPPGFAPTNRRVELEGTSVLRFCDRQVVAVRLFFDATDAARQLLAAPRPGSPIERVVVLGQRLRARASRRG